jgi:hypothetical protein
MPDPCASISEGPIDVTPELCPGEPAAMMDVLNVWSSMLDTLAAKPCSPMGQATIDVYEPGCACP